MAGKRQHYIPRFLQRGFLADGGTGAERTYLHRRNAQPTLVGIRDVGVEEYFYSKLNIDGSANLDDVITAIEQEVLEDLYCVKNANAGEHIDPVFAVHLIAHLTVRTAHVRATLQSAVNYISSELSSLFSDSQRLRELIRVDALGSSTISTIITEEILRSKNFARLEIPIAFLKRVITYSLREHLDENLFNYSSDTTLEYTEIQKNLKSIIRDSHINALDKALPNMSGWKKGLSDMTWQTHAVVNAILPDCVVLAREAGQMLAPFLFCDKDKLDLILLPISHDRLLVGSYSEQIDIDISLVNAASAACSDRFFISHCAQKNDELCVRIGERTNQAITESVESALVDLRMVRVPHYSGEKSTTYKADKQGPFTYSIACNGLEDDNSAAKIVEIVKYVVFELNQRLPLSNLQGITFAKDYALALRDLDCGDQAIEQSSGTTLVYGQAVAKCVKVMCATERKTHIVLDAVIAEHLLSDDLTLNASALQILVGMLAGVTHSTLWEARIDNPASVQLDQVLQLLHPAIAIAPSQYFCAKESAFVDPTGGDRYALLALGSLKTAFTEIESARRAYRENNDLDGLFSVALERASFVVRHAAEWLGHRDGISTQTNFSSVDLSEALSDYGLRQWLELLGRDLRDLYEVDGRFTAENIYALARHAERLLWIFRVCPWETDDGRVYISVPMGEDE